MKIIVFLLAALAAALGQMSNEEIKQMLETFDLSGAPKNFQECQAACHHVFANNTVNFRACRSACALIMG